MDEDDDDDVGGADALVELGQHVLEALDAENVGVTLHQGRPVEGSIVSFVMKKKTKKGGASWSGSLALKTESGVLQIDCSNVASIERR